MKKVNSNLVNRLLSRNRSVFPQTCKLWEELSATVFPERYDMSYFKRGLRKALLLR